MNDALSQTASTLQTAINTNTDSMAADRSTTTFLLSDKASNNYVLAVQQEAHTYAFNYTNTQV